MYYIQYLSSQSLFHLIAKYQPLVMFDVKLQEPHRSSVHLLDLTSADDILLGLCKRRQWPQPHYESYSTSAGYACVARVNNREYQTDTTYGSDLLARENAAMRAYLICRNFSVNDGMYPSGHAKGPVIQGLPVAIGTERRSVYTDDHEYSSRSGGSSPRSYESNSSYGDSRRDSRRISGSGRPVRYETRRY
ncbi:MAG: hypothetical protein Q9184_004882 [Pyrenodesmia sp. 2 TL-2023]